MEHEIRNMGEGKHEIWNMGEWKHGIMETGACVRMLSGQKS